MRREIRSWYSPRLFKNMEIVTYGHYGFAVLLFPTAAADYLEYERFQLIDTLAPMINAGKIKVFSINSINNESWLNKRVEPRIKSLWQQAYNEYITEEVVPYIHWQCGGLVPIITSGASFGALHSANQFFRRPDIFAGCISMSGSYDLKDYSDGYFDDIVYFNSPIDYLYHQHDEGALNMLRHNKRIIIATGQGNYEKPSASINLSNLLHSKGIPHELDLWGHDIGHDWPTWRSMLPYFLGSRF
jgi:esterase/lipase superfamily enzyme